MRDMDEVVNIDLEPEDALRVLLNAQPLGAAETVEPVDEGTVAYGSERAGGAIPPGYLPPMCSIVADGLRPGGERSAASRGPVSQEVR